MDDHQTQRICAAILAGHAATAEAATTSDTSAERYVRIYRDVLAALKNEESAAMTARAVNDMVNRDRR